ncbi:PREDICTED: molybdenum cofactor sulfurase [Tarenaya hassleriana]|uniref:molybdenum cofactor sulfurase n=1 Tax=Tarenaya hassleriana TaxID=28532 RepID=UPI00053C36D7|nr:PREDICTED: molybdenum cofactor sulfurase [Tarenaya hassleriana]
MKQPCPGDSSPPPQNCLHGCFSSHLLSSSDDPPPQNTAVSGLTSATLRRDFARTTVSTVFADAIFTDPNSLPSLQESFSNFIQAFSKYSQTYKIDRIRTDQYFHLALSNHTCLDYIGIGLYSYSQLLNYDPASYQIPSSLSESPFFSVSPTVGNLKERLLHDGGQETEFECAMKKRIMGFLKISEDDYSMVFTVNRTSAFRLVAESYPFQSNRRVLSVYDYESEAVDEMNRVSEKRGAKVSAAEFSWPRLRICSSKLRKMVTSGKKGSKKKGIFVFPLHSRVTGSRYPYLWLSVAQENGWHVMIDACALGPKDMDSFGLSIYHPDFMVCSFYKVFGENPSGFGCLFVKKSTVQVLESSTSSGMINLVAMNNPFSLPTSEMNRVLPESDETDSWRSFESIECRCLDHIDSLGLVMTSNRSRCLINWLASALLKLKHPKTVGGDSSSNSEKRLVKIYGPKVNFNRGPALAFDLFDQKGGRIEPLIVQKLAEHSSISLGLGFLRNIWFGEEYEDVKESVLEKRRNKTDPGVSVVTIALGFLANFEDVYRFWSFVGRFLDSEFVEKERCRYGVLEHKSREVL